MTTNEVLAIALKALKKGGGGGGGTSNYNELSNLPQINGITLQGNKSSSDLEIPNLVIISEDDYNALSNEEKHDLTKLYFLYDAGGEGGTDDYTNLNNKPQINSVTLVGNKSFDDLGIGSDIDLQPSQLDNLLDLIDDGDEGD